MFKHILVPLDGSVLAEVALPVAVSLARRLGARLTLLHVIERHAPAMVHGARHLVRADEAEAYLQNLRRQVEPADLTVLCHVHETEETDVARSIVAHEHEFTPDLIVLCAHGHSGLRGRLFGRIAEQVVAAGRVPVLMLRPREPAPLSAALWEKFLVPVDGSAEHEISLCIAEGLALATGAALELVCVVPTTETLAGPQAAAGQLLPGAARAVLDLAYEQARNYVQQQMERMQRKNLKVTGQVLRGDPVPTLLQALEKSDATLLVLATHGHAGLGAFWAASVAPRVLACTALPALLVPVVRSPASS
ncbi:MAG: universal stress protein [Kiritimatiellaeota bacterium]|nr:universal stress protein [Kiritimatiellota bacterium]